MRSADRGDVQRDAPEDLVAGDDGYEAIARGILDAAQQDETGAWRMPWHGVASCPMNAFSGRCFTGANALSLGAAARRGRFSVHLWAPLPQWEKKGGRIRPGEPGTLILVPQFDDAGPAARWDRNTQGIETKVGPLGGAAEGGEIRRILGFKKERWWNLHQVDGMEIAPPSVPEPTVAAAALEGGLRRWFANDGPSLVHGGMRACWYASTDRIQMPPVEAFRPHAGLGGYEYYVLTVAHEAGHATGAGSRLCRDMTGKFGSPKYAREELVAELTSAFVCATFGMPTELMQHNAAYVRSWLAAMSDRNRRKAFFWAVREAERAAGYLLDRVHDKETSPPAFSRR